MRYDILCQMAINKHCFDAQQMGCYKTLDELAFKFSARYIQCRCTWFLSLMQLSNKVTKFDLWTICIQGSKWKKVSTKQVWSQVLKKYKMETIGTKVTK